MTTTNDNDNDFYLLDFILAFEHGTITDDELVEGFQHLVDTGLAWQLQGVYGRTAARLIDAGLVHPKEAT